MGGEVRRWRREGETIDPRPSPERKMKRANRVREEKKRSGEGDASKTTKETVPPKTGTEKLRREARHIPVAEYRGHRRKKKKRDFLGKEGVMWGQEEGKDTRRALKSVDKARQEKEVLA